MMKINKIVALATFMIFGLPCIAGERLDDINRQVESQAQLIDDEFGVLLDYQERNDLKLDLIARQALQDTLEQDMSVEAIVEGAIVNYELTDPAEQRRLLIKLRSQTVTQKSAGATSNEPDFP